VGIVISLILIAVGAILTFAVNQSSSGAVDIDVVGVVLMIVGFVLFLLSLMLWRTWWGPGMWAGPGPYDEGGDVVVRRRYAWPTRRRTTYVEDEPPPGP
jgi:hypothetical protein